MKSIRVLFKLIRLKILTLTIFLSGSSALAQSFVDTQALSLLNDQAEALFQGVSTEQMDSGKAFDIVRWSHKKELENLDLNIRSFLLSSEAGIHEKEQINPLQLHPYLLFRFLYLANESKKYLLKRDFFEDIAPAIRQNDLKITQKVLLYLRGIYFAKYSIDAQKVRFFDRYYTIMYAYDLVHYEAFSLMIDLQLNFHELTSILGDGFRRHLIFVIEKGGCRYYSRPKKFHKRCDEFFSSQEGSN